MITCFCDRVQLQTVMISNFHSMIIASKMTHNNDFLKMAVENVITIYTLILG